MMNFKEFSERMENDLKNALAESFPGTDVQRREVEKMQSQSYTALSVSPENGKIAANVNLNRLYDQMEAGASYEEVMKSAVDQSQDFLENIPQFGVASLADYEQSKSLLFVEVVSAERNAEMLQKVPYMQIEDMAMVYRLQISNLGQGYATALVTNDMLDTFGISAEQLHQDALANSMEIKPVQVESLSKVIAELTGMPEEIIAGSTPDIFVVSNADRMKGAGALFYPEVMDQITEQLGGDFFVLPSSVHEVLVMPDTGMESAEELKAMVTSINGDVVEPGDVLTDQVYHYDSKDCVFELGEKFEARKAEKELSEQDRGSVLKALKDKQKDVLPPKIAKDTKNRSDMEL